MSECHPTGPAEGAGEAREHRPGSPGPSDDDPLVALAEEFAASYRRGERPDLSVYTDRYPEYAERIRRLFPAMVAMEEFGSIEAPAAGPVGPKREPRGSVPGRMGDFHVLREIGRGGMGVVYEAEQISLGRRVALKVLPRPAAGDEKVMTRFLREARSAARLHHTNIVPVFEVGREGDDTFYAMQYIQGKGLDQVIDELRRLRSCPTPSKDASLASPVRTLEEPVEKALGRLVSSVLTGQFDVPTPSSAAPPPTVTFDDHPRRVTVPGPQATQTGGPPGHAAAGGPGDPSVLPGGSKLSDAGSDWQTYDRSVARVGHQVAGALAYAHASGVVHRDIKPANLLLDTAGVVWVADFGLAKAEEDGLTRTGDVVGTLRYMAPERFRGEGDARADVYALGLTLYELLTLRPAFETSDRFRLIEQIKNREPTRPRAIDGRIARDLETIVLTATAKDPDRRYQTAEAMAEDLRRFLADEPIQARRAGVARRLSLWARRRPAEAALAATSFLAALAVLGTAVSLWYGAQLRAERDRAEAFEYSQQITLANVAWRDGNMGQLEELLDTCPPGFRRNWEWRYLKGQCHSELVKFEGHRGGIFDLAYSPDGRLLATASMDTTARLWDAATGRLLRTFEGHTNDVLSVAFHPDGTQLATSSADGTVKVWDVATGRPLHSFRHDENVYGWNAVYTRDGASLLVAGSDGAVRVVDPVTGEAVAWRGGHTGTVQQVVISRDGRRAASAGSDGTVRVWDVERGCEVLPPLRGHGGEIWGVAFSPDGTRLATAGADTTVKLWDATTGKLIRTLQGHASLVLRVAFSPDGKRLASASGDPSMKLWDVETGREVFTIRGHGGQVWAVAFHPDGEHLVTGSQDRTAKLWGLTDPAVLVLRGHAGAVNGVAFHPSARRLASAGADQTVKIWDLSTGKFQTLTGHEAPVRSVAYSPRGGLVLASADGKGVVRLWDADTGRLVRALDDDHGGEVAGMAFRPDGNVLAAAGADGAVRIWNVQSGVLLRTYRGHTRSVRSLAYSPDGLSLATGGEDRTVIVRGDSEDSVTYTCRGHACWVHSVTYSSDGRFLTTAGGVAQESRPAARMASGSGDGTVKIWDTSTGREVRSIRGHGNFVQGVAFSPDGTRLASASMDRTVKLWDVTSGREVLALRDQGAGFLGVAFSPDGDQIAAAGADGAVRVWEARP